LAQAVLAQASQGAPLLMACVSPKIPLLIAAAWFIFIGVPILFALCRRALQGAKALHTTPYYSRRRRHKRSSNETSWEKVFEHTATFAAEKPCSAAFLGRALLTPFGLGSAMNNFVNEFLIALHNGESYALCQPVGHQIFWDELFETIPLPRCRDCKLDDDLNVYEEIVEDMNRSRQGWRRADVEQRKRFLCRRLYRPGPELRNATTRLQDELGLRGQRYIGVHIRRSDKYGEAKPMNTSVYAQEVRKLSKAVDAKLVFVASDDKTEHGKLQGILGSSFHVVQQPRLEDYFYQFRTYHHNTKANFNLLVDLELLVKSDAFVGTASSNLGRFVYFLRGSRDPSTSVDDSGDFLFRPG